MSATMTNRPAGATAANGPRRPLPRFATRAASPEGAVVLMVLVFLIISAVWLSIDRRMPVGDSGRHLGIAFSFADALGAGRLAEPFGAFTQYPPLIHVVAALGLLVFGDSIMAAVMTINVVFVPLLALGIYGTGRVATGDRRVGALAVAFALASPMVIGLFHELMIDTAQAALVAVSVWLLLLSDRFRRIGIAGLAGVAVAAGFMSKATFVLFVVGVVLVMLLRGGWRNWRGFGLFALVTLVLIEPWYFRHSASLSSMTGGAAAPQQVMWYGSVPYPARWSFDDFTWYVWSLVNSQLFLPLTLFTVAGIVFALVRWARTRKPDGLLPELLGGLAVSYVAITFISLNDPRYTLPALVFMAVLGTAWIVRLPRRLGLAVAGVLVALLVVNTTMVNTGRGGDAVVTLKATPAGEAKNPIGAGTLTVFSKQGYIAGSSAPDRDGGPMRRVLDLLKRARADGRQKIFFQPESMNSGGFTLAALSVYAELAGMEIVGFTGIDAERLPADGLYVFRTLPEFVTDGGKPCLISWDDTGLFMLEGQPRKKNNRYYCPPPGPVQG